MLAETSFLIDFLRGKEEAINFLQKQQIPIFYTTEICIFELVAGAYALRDEPQKELQKIFSLLSKMVVLPADRKSMLKAGEIAGTLIKKGKKIEDTDCLIAGISLSNGIFEILTTNKEHFERIPELKVISY